MRRYNCLIHYVLLLVTISTPTIVQGAGFAILQQGTAPMAQGNAFTAQADDPTAIFFNPAGISQLSGTNAYLGQTTIYPRVEYEADHSDESTIKKVHIVPQIYITHQLTNDIYLGLGIFSPFGLSTPWDEDWAGRYLSTYSNLETYNINPNVCYRWHNLSLSAGVNFLNADLELKKKIFLGAFPEGRQKLTGDAWGTGYNLGLLYKFDERLQAGISYRSRIWLDFDDSKARFDVPDLMKSFFKNTSGSGTLELPPSLNAGLSYSPSKRLAVEFDITWTGWSTYDEMELHFDSPIGPPGKASDRYVQPKRWEDVFAYRIGLKYGFTPAATLRLGFIYDNTPVPDETLDPQLPDADKMIYTAGIEYRWSKRLITGIAYNYINGRNRTKDNDILPSLPEAFKANGRYEQSVHSLGLSINYQF